jgi:DNA invertase Pin-like site-specific DNA recombinase
MADVAVIYCRRSDPYAKSDDPAFEQQEQECRKYCAERGHQVLVARREAYTGTDLENQTELWNTIDDVKHGRATLVIAYSYDRLSREPQMQEVALYEIENKYGGTFEAATEQIDRNDPLRTAFRSMLGAASLVERRRIVQRMQRGKKDRIARGLQPGGLIPKFGFKWRDDWKSVKDNPGHTTYEIDRKSAAVVARIYGWSDQGKSNRWITRQLNTEGTPTPAQTAGKGPDGGWWHTEMVRRILKDPAYKGEMHVYTKKVTKEYVKNGDTGIVEKKRIVRSRDQSEHQSISCPAIISADQWARVQRVTPKEGRPPLDPREAVLRGRVYCLCGSKMRLYQRTPGVYVYTCGARRSAYTSGAHICPYAGGPTISARIVNKQAVEEALRVASMQGVLEQFLNRETAENKPLHAIAENLTIKIQRKSAEKAKYLDGIALAEDASVIQALVEKAEQCSREIQEATEELAKARERLDSVVQHTEASHRFIARLQLANSFKQPHQWTPEELRELFNLLGLKAIVAPSNAGPERVRVEFQPEIFRGTPSKWNVPL